MLRNTLLSVSGPISCGRSQFEFSAQGIMHDMDGVNPLNQLMASNGQPTALGWNYLT
jgi:hypothetical protein